jgi:gliding motility-associated protein GldM
MAQSKTTTRQKMINMMYLVLTAMLALNVSSEVLKAFHKMEVSLDHSGKNLDETNAKLLIAMDMEVEKQGAKAQVYRDKAYEAKKISEEFIGYIHELKEYLLKKHGGRLENGELKEADNLEAAMGFFMNERDDSKKGKELLERINTTRVALLHLLDEKDRAAIKTDLVTPDPLPNNEGIKKSWLEESFENLPLAAAFANLTKLENDAKKTESDVITSLASQIYVQQYHFNALEATIVAPYGSVSTGQTYNAEIFLSAFNKNSNYTMKINGQPVEVVNGKGIYKVTPNSEGKFDYKAEILVPDPITNESKSYTATSSYQVFAPQASVSVANMRVFYAGIDNPVDITVPGYRPDQVTASIENGTISGQGGKYVVNTTMSQNRIVKINVVARADDGNTKSFTQQFTIRPMPPLQNSINGLTNGVISVDEARLFNFLRCDFGQYFPLTTQAYQVTKYTCYIQSRDPRVYNDIHSNQLTNDIKAHISKCRRGDLILFYNIEGRGANGNTIRNGNSLVFTIK